MSKLLQRLRENEFSFAALILVLIALVGIGLSYHTVIKDQQAQESAIAEGNTPLAILENNEFDWGNIPRGKPVQKDFVLSNPSDFDLKITKIVTSCGCTTADLWIAEEKQNIPTVIPAQSSGVIKVVFDPDAHNSRGLTKRAVRIETNDPNHPFLIINLLANVQ